MEKKIVFCPSIQRKKRIFLWAAIIVGIILVVGIGAYFIFGSSETNDTPPVDEFKYHENEEIKIFQKYLRFPTISLQSDFGPCVEYLKGLAEDSGLDVSIQYPVSKEKPLVLMTWQGLEPTLPSILLNSHMDVVPVAAEFWKYPPFGANIDEKGNIYARGAQDMKSIGMLYLAAIRALKRKGIKQLKRTIHLTYVPDEETGGGYGMQAFARSSKFKSLSVGCALDEGYPSESSKDLELFYLEKTSWWIYVNATGNSGHSSVLHENTAFEKLNYVMNKFLEMRRDELRKFKELNYPYGNVTVINFTELLGGIKLNIVPPKMSFFVDMRLAADANWGELERTIKSWEREAGGNLTITISKSARSVATRVDNSNPYWIALKNATEQMNLNVRPTIFRAGTDSRILRRLNIPALGFSPLLNTPPQLHEPNECVNIKNYLRGIEIYEKVIEAMANV